MIDATHNLTMRVSPVNNPTKFNEAGEQTGYYHAYIAHHSALCTAEEKIFQAEQEWMRGIISRTVGYGTGATPISAIEHALADYQNKFGDLCIVDTEQV